MSSLTIFYVNGSRPNTVLNNVSSEEHDKAVTALHKGEPLLIRFESRLGVSSLFGTDNLDAIRGFAYEGDLE